MRKKLDLLWLFFILVSVSLAVYLTPYQIPLPRPGGGRYPVATPAIQLSGGRYLKLIPTCPAPGSNTYVPNQFTFNCTGSRHAKAYTGFKGATNYPHYDDAEQGLLDHP